LKIKELEKIESSGYNGSKKILEIPKPITLSKLDENSILKTGHLLKNQNSNSNVLIIKCRIKIIISLKD
jgi:hypothetical protein